MSREAIITALPGAGKGGLVTIFAHDCGGLAKI
jgi:hypothetical protein